MAASRIFARLAELLDVNVHRGAEVWLRLDTTGEVSQLTAPQTLEALGAASLTALAGKASLTDANNFTATQSFAQPVYLSGAVLGVVTSPIAGAYNGPGTGLTGTAANLSVGTASTAAYATTAGTANALAGILPITSGGTGVGSVGELGTFRTALGSGSTGDLLFQAVTPQEAFAKIGTLETTSPNNIINTLVYEFDPSIGTADGHIRLAPKGQGGVRLGNSAGNARGILSIDLQLDRSGTQVASGARAVALGRSNTASGSSSCAIGDGNIASGVAVSVAIGGGCTSSGNRSVAFGWDCMSLSTASNAMGWQSSANRTGQFAAAAGMFAVKGDAQRTDFVLRCKTTTNSAVQMALNGGVDYLLLNNGSVLAMKINICGIKSDGSASAHFLRQYAVKRVGGTVSEVYAPVTVGVDHAVGTSVVLSADDTGKFVSIQVTGIAAEIWRWVAHVEAVEIAHGT